MSNPYAESSIDELLEHKDRLALDIARRLADFGIRPDYAVTVMAEARRLPEADRIALLEGLVELEALKYHLAARRVRELEAQ